MINIFNMPGKLL